MCLKYLLTPINNNSNEVCKGKFHSKFVIPCVLLIFYFNISKKLQKSSKTCIFNAFHYIKIKIKNSKKKIDKIQSRKKTNNIYQA